MIKLAETYFEIIDILSEIVEFMWLITNYPRWVRRGFLLLFPITIPVYIIITIIIYIVIFILLILGTLIGSILLVIDYVIKELWR